MLMVERVRRDKAMLAKEIIKQGKIAFGTSGARGLVADFTPKICTAFTTSFLSSNDSYNRVAIGIDNRPSSPKIASDCIRAAKALGIDVDYYGVLPTPALAYQSMHDGIPSIMITGSHIPFDRNGIKFYRPDGEITKADEQAILNSCAEVNAQSLQNSQELTLPEVSQTAVDNYIKRYTDIYPSYLLKNKRIGIYEHSSAGRDVYPHIFGALGAEVVSLGRSDTFVPIDTEAVAQSDIDQAKAWTKELNLDAVFSTDGDGDRPLLSDETGEYLRGDILCLLAAKNLHIEALAVPVSCNSAIEQCGEFKTTVRTKIGSPYVIEAFAELNNIHNAVAGFEANGGFLLASDIKINQQTLKALPTRDAVLPVLAVLSNPNGVTVQVEALPSIYTASNRIQGIAREDTLVLIEKVKADPRFLMNKIGIQEATVINANTVDGYRMTLSTCDVIHLRPSGNAPELRCYIESSSKSQAESMVSNIINTIRN